MLSLGFRVRNMVRDRNRAMVRDRVMCKVRVSVWSVLYFLKGRLWPFV